MSATEQASDLSFREAFEHLPVGAFIARESARLSYLNQAAEELLGYTRDEVLGNPVTMLLAESQRKRYDEATQRLLASGQPGTPRVVLALEARHKDGTVLPVEVSVSAARFDGSPIFMGIVRGVAEPRRSDEALRNLEEYFEDFYENAPDMLCSVDAETAAIKDCNRTLATRLGYSREEVIGRPVFDMYHPDCANEVKRVFESFVTAGRVTNAELQLRCKDGSGVDVLLNATAVRDETGRVTHSRSTWRDITERKRIERRLASQDRLYSTLVECVPDLIWVADGDGQVTFLNQAWSTLTGRGVGDSLGRGWVEATHPDDAPAVLAMLERASEQGEPYAGECRFACSDGSYRRYELVGVPVRDEPGAVGCWVGIGRDVTERQETEQENERLNAVLKRRLAQVEYANKEMEAFAYSVSHDLRAPLRSMDGFSRALLDKYADQLDAKGRHYLERIRVGSQTMSQLIDGILALSRISRSEFKLDEVDLSAVARDLAAMFTRSSPERRVEFVVADRLATRGDRRLVRTALQNLLGNAWKFTEQEPIARIEVGITDEGEYFVRDNGVGFDEQYADKLFGAFQRLHASADFEGLGIGLATVQRIVRRHGGHVRGEGTPGGGATFYFTLDDEA